MLGVDCVDMQADINTRAVAELQSVNQRDQEGDNMGFMAIPSGQR